MRTFGRRPLTPSQQPSAWEVELGDQCPSLRPRELRVSSGASSESELDSTGVILIFFVDWVSWVMRLSISVFLSSSGCCSSSLSAALILDFPSSTFFFTRARASPFVVFRMLEVLPFMSPSSPSPMARLTSFFLGLTLLTRPTSESSFSAPHCYPRLDEIPLQPSLFPWLWVLLKMEWQPEASLQMRKW